MQPDHAVILRDAFAAQLKSEHRATRRVIEAAPAGQGDYAPDAKCMPAMKLAWHIAASEIWFLNSVAAGEFKRSGGGMPEEIQSGADVAAWYEAQFEPAIARVEQLTGEDLAKAVPFGPWNNPLVDTLSFALRHTIHHRGQLSAYLRPMGGKVPSIYGPSADEPLPTTAAKA